MPRLTGPCLFPGTHEYMYFISRSFPNLLLSKSILLSVETVIHFLKAGLESGVAKAAILKLRNTFIAAETMLGKGLSFWVFVFFVLKRKGCFFFFYCKEMPVNCADLPILHNLKENVS